MLHKLFVTIKKRYRSPIDKALETFRKNRPISKSQEAEIKKHEKHWVFTCVDSKMLLLLKKHWVFHLF